MRAIILAAGRGRRLEQAGERRPKCLLEFGGVSLLDRHLRNLASLGVDDVRLCVGYQSERVLEALDASALGRRVSTVCNPDFLEGSILSLWVMRAALDGGDDVLLMDADVLYAPAILERLARGPHRTALAIDRDFVPGDERVKVCLRAGRVVEFSQRVAPEVAWDVCGESVGFFRFAAERAPALAERTGRLVAAGRRAAPHEDALRAVMLEEPEAFGVEDVTGLPWIEIDFPDDVVRARDSILPRLA
jgi:choline kinase